MTERLTNEPDERQSTGIRRRGLFAAAAAVVAAIVARTSQQVEAGVDGDVVLGATNGAASTTVVRNTAAYSTSGAALLGLRHTTTLNITPSYRVGVYGHSAASTSAVGVFGEAGNSSGGIGVQGFGDGAGAGVFGLSPTGPGVLGQNNFAGIGVKGEITNFNSAASTIGVLGLNDSDSAGGMALRGTIPNSSNGANTIAVYGENFSSNTGGAPGNGGFGCYGYSLNGHGLIGATGTAGGGGVIGSTNGLAGAYAGIFYGPFVVVGGSKSAAVAHPDGQHRLLYCVEAPDSWFEDIGEGVLVNGRAEIALDPEFTRIVEADCYHVFLTEHDRHNDLYVTERTTRGFVVQADVAALASKGRMPQELNGSFSWRVVAKRADIRTERFSKTTLPAEPRRPLSPATGDGHVRADAPSVTDVGGEIRTR